MENLSPSEYAELINKVLIFLKEHKISQNSVGNRINYYSLSKAKNIKSYPQKIVEGKTRPEVYNRILEAYNIVYNSEKDVFKSLNDDIINKPHKDDFIYYVIYYYSYAKQIVGKGLVSINEKKWATIDFNDPNHTPSIWKGSFDVVEGYTFLSLEKKGDTAPVKAFYSFFSGTIKHGRPILIGTYSTIKRDGSPTAGNIVMEKIASRDQALEKINGGTNPKITAFLLNKNFTIETITPSTIEDLPKLLLNTIFIGEYTIYWPYKKEVVLKGAITIKETSETEAVFEDRIFKGTSELTNSNTLFLKLRNSKVNRNLKSNDLYAYLNINNYNNERGVMAGVLITPSLLSMPSSFPILLVKKNKTLSKDQIETYFDSFSAPLFSAIEPIELASLIEEY